MADVNKVILIGRLTRDPEVRSFSNGGRVAKFGFAVGSRRRNQQTGQWEDGETMFIDCSAFNRGEFGKLADTVERFLRKGSQCYLEGRLKLDTWDDKTSGQKRSKHELIVEVMQMLDTRQQSSEGGGYNRPSASADRSRQGPPQDQYSDFNEPAHAGGNSGMSEDIPF